MVKKEALATVLVIGYVGYVVFRNLPQNIYWKEGVIVDKIPMSPLARTKSIDTNYVIEFPDGTQVILHEHHTFCEIDDRVELPYYHYPGFLPHPRWRLAYKARKVEE